MLPEPEDPRLYLLLKEIARTHLRRERPGHTLQPTALVHEAWLRLAPEASAPRAEILAAAATAMRRILVDHARRRLARRRGGGQERVTLHEESLGAAPAAVDVLELDEAMQRLAQLDARQARIVELRFFAGLTADEVADLLGVSRRTVQGDWSMARAFLRRCLADGAA